MFLGHGLLAFALVATAGRVADWPRERVLSLAVLAFAFATLPDVDIVYAPVGLLGGASGVFDAATAFWRTGNVVHRTVTHSLVVGVVGAPAFACWLAATDRTSPAPRRLLAGVASTALLSALFVTALLVTGGLAALVVAVFALGGIAVAALSRRLWAPIAPRDLGAVALVGLLTHPFGDLFTGEPPALLYPLDVTLVAERVSLHPDPTLHLLAAFALELATVWLAVHAFATLADRRVPGHVRPRAAVGLGYAAAAVVLPAPTLDVSYHFVFSVLAVSAVGAFEFRPATVAPTDGGADPARATVPAWGPVLDRFGADDSFAAVVTGLAAVTLAVLGYTAAYLLL